MKRLSAFLCALLLLSCLSTNAEAAPMLFKVNDTNGHTLYLLPSIHVGNDEVEASLSGLVNDVFKKCDQMAVELDIGALSTNVKEQAALSPLITYPFLDSVKNHLPPQTLEASKALLQEAGLYNVHLLSTRAALWPSLLDMAVATLCGLNAEQGVDYIMLKRAHERGLPIIEMETAQAQYQALLTANDGLSEWLIGQTTQDVALAKQNVLLLVQAFLEGDQALLTSVALPNYDALTGSLEEDADKYMDELLVKRDLQFTQRAKQFLASGDTVLFMVGAMHIVGENGILESLTAQGYTVTQLQ